MDDLEGTTLHVTHEGAPPLKSSRASPSRYSLRVLACRSENKHGRGQGLDFLKGGGGGKSIDTRYCSSGPSSSLRARPTGSFVAAGPVDMTKRDASVSQDSLLANWELQNGVADP